MKPTIADAGNTLVPAYLALLARGYAVRRDEAASLGPEELWIAEDAHRVLMAGDPLTLLGLAAMVETRGEDWPASDEEIDRFLAEFGYD